MIHTDACPECLERSWLLAMLGPYIERTVLHQGTSELLALPDKELACRAAGAEAPRILATLAATSEDRMRSEIEEAGCWAVCHHSARFPSALRDLDSPPRALIGRGRPAVLAEHPADRAVAIVGSRRATSYGREAARTLASELASAGVLVVSGLAFGIDACAHRGSLDSGGPTAAVLGCGPDSPYPAAHRGLWRSIGEHGVVVSELPPGSVPWRWTFPVRNRIIAGLAGVTIVVEAAARSGSLVTARLAREAGRTLGAVPGPVNCRQSSGPNQLLADGAYVVRGAEDVMALLRHS
jgi:DNA processing protein